MNTPYFKEIFEFPIQDFKAHLEQPFNDRIIFSGKYGIGKTRFLIDFFEEDNQRLIFKEVNYKVYRLSPINYSVATNDDIFRYIKYDIIIEMLKNGIKLEEVKIGIETTFPDFVKINSLKVIAGLVRMIPKIGKEIIECFRES